MPVSSSRRKSDKKGKGKNRVVARRTSGWQLIQQSRSVINAIMMAVGAVATITKDEAALHFTDEARTTVHENLKVIRETLIINKETQETIAQAAEVHYSAALGLVNQSPYVKESQLGPCVNGLSQLMMTVVQQVLPPLGVLMDELLEVDNLNEYHVALMQRATASIEHVKGVSHA